ncbi:MAG: right-handed parallel beta-helix repeat-containing protein [bacterium]
MSNAWLVCADKGDGDLFESEVQGVLITQEITPLCQTGRGGDAALYCPGVQGEMTPGEQMECAAYIYLNFQTELEIGFRSKTKFIGYSQEVVDSLLLWINARMNDGKSDVLLIIDMCPAALFHGEESGSLAEEWMRNGNMLIWTGSEPFSSYMDVSGTRGDQGAGPEGVGKVLGVASSGLCRGGGRQEPTTAVWDYNDADGDYNIDSFVGYEAQYALKYDQLLIDATTAPFFTTTSCPLADAAPSVASSPGAALVSSAVPYWRVEEIFAEDSERYQSDDIVLVNIANGRYGQFYCLPGFNQARMKVISQVLNNWVALPCRTLIVPDQYPTIQEAIDAANPRDTVLVRAGTYHERLILKRGVKLISDADNGGHEFHAGPGYADSLYDVQSKRVQARTLDTIIDGTGFSGTVNARPMIDFPKGATVSTLVDGFTITHMPRVDHAKSKSDHIPTVQLWGASGTIINCIISDNGSSGICSSALFHEQEAAVGDYQQFDFRYTNIKYDSHPILTNNVICRSEGSNVENHRYSYAICLNNECFESLSPVGRLHASGIVNQHGSHALIVKNLIYQCAWVGIGSRKGVDQGKYPVDRPTHPIIRYNRVYDSGVHDTSGTFRCGAGIGTDGTGGSDPKTGTFVYTIIEGNYVKGAANAAIGCRSDGQDDGYVRIINNEVTEGGRRGFGAGIGIDGAHAAEISCNCTYGNHDAGIGICNGGICDLISFNVSHHNGAAGIGLTDGATVGEISQNTIYENKAAGIGHDGTKGKILVTFEAYNTITDNGTAGIGIVASEINEIRGNTIMNNAGPGITVISGSLARLIADTTLDYNGIANRATGLSVLNGSCAFLRNISISHSGTTGISIFHQNTSVTLENCQISNNGQCGYGANLTVQSGASAVARNCLFDVPVQGSPNIMVSGSDTVLTQSGNSLTGSTKPGLVASAGATVIIRDTLIDGKSLAGEIVNDTRGLQLDDCMIDLERIIVCNSAHHALAASNCTGRIVGCEFFENALASGGHITISNSTLDLIGNIIHHPVGFQYQIEVKAGSSCKIYHNTIVGRSFGRAGAINQGPGDGVHVDATSTAYILNNIFMALPRGIGMEDGATVIAERNCFYQLTGADKGIWGDEPILEDPKLTSCYTLMPDSPCLDTAIPIPGVNDNYTGTGPDVGAREYAAQIRT